MADNPSVSVIVPMYNVEKYIKLCVDSILAQTFQDFEIILVDDASPDNCFELCQKLYGGNDKVRIVRHEKNLGLGPARNTGIKNARGKYVYFIDSDDYILPEALEKFYAAAEKTNAQVVHAAGRYELVQSDSDPVGKGTLTLKWDRYSQEGFLKNDAVYRLENHWKTYDTRSNAWLCFCRRDFLEENNIEFLPIISEDEPFSLVLFCTAERYYILREAFYVHLLRTGSIMRSFEPKRLAQGIYAMIASAPYAENILDKIPKFKGYETWREDFMTRLLERFLNNHTLPFYTDPKNIALVNETAKKTLSETFGQSTSFVKHFFNNYHIFRNQNIALSNKLKASTLLVNKLKKEQVALKKKQIALQNESKKFQAQVATFIREFPALLNIMSAVKSYKKKILIMGTPQHGNLGDHAIVLGEMHILKNYFPNYAIIEIPVDYLIGEVGELLWGLGLEKYINRNDIIFCCGGGNLGNLWINNEIVRRVIITKFPENKLVIFPQSIYFTEDDAGRKELAISQRIYNAHSDLHLMTRDENSFALAKRFFPRINNYLLPDAATILHGVFDMHKDKREGVLFILRNDKEKVRNDDKIQLLQKAFNAAKVPFEVIDTVINEKVTPDIREQKVREVLLKVRKSKLVITDRFHGVVFSFVTRTPVLAFKSYDTKISSGVKWFENLSSIFYAEEQDSTSVEKFINQALTGDAPFAEMNPEVKLSNKNNFFAVLNKIVTANKIYPIESTPPKLYKSGELTERKFYE